jgi:hypothetical protein
MTAEPHLDAGQQAYQAFLRDLPELYKTHPNQFVAYQGGKRLKVSKDDRALYLECEAAGLKWGDFYIFGIVPQDDDIWVESFGE